MPYHGGIAVRRTFANLDGPQNTKGLPDVLRWKLGLHDQTQPRTPSTGVEIPVLANDGRALRAATRDALTWIGHASFLVQLGGRSVLLDPILSTRIVTLEHNVPPGLGYEALLGAERFVAMHWGTFKLTDEDLREPPQRLREIWERDGLPNARRSIPAIGQTVWLGD